ncbi:hypothetical protein RDABS01_036160, partial [Bienertia sinuspersici]
MDTHPPNFRPLPGHRAEDGDPHYVYELIEEGKLKVNTLNDIFSKWECEEIQKIVLPQSQLEDVWTWHHTKNGLFNVKSAYFIAQQEKGSAGPAFSSDQRDEVWDKVWRAKVPLKIKIFAWKSIHYGLAVRCNLAKKGMEVDPICPRCGESPETELLMLFSCKEARYAWYYSPLRLECNMDGSASVYKWVRGLMRHFETDEWDYIGDVIATTCYCERGRVAPDVAEAMTVRHATKIAYEAGLRRMVLESDCMKLVTQLRRGRGDPTNFGVIVNDIIAWGRSCIQFATSFVRRSGNR